jgi:hypothetical protein
MGHEAPGDVQPETGKDDLVHATTRAPLTDAPNCAPLIF